MLILYDGVCGLCNWFVQFTVRRDPNAQFKYASLQSSTGQRLLQKHGRDPSSIDTVVLVLDYELPTERTLIKARAGLTVLKFLGWPHRAAYAFAIFPDFLLNIFYDLMAKLRYRLFGKHDVCQIPTPDERRRFIDV